jgi:hypothetical protein
VEEREKKDGGISFLRPALSNSAWSHFSFAVRGDSVNNRGMTIAMKHGTGVSGRDLREQTTIVGPLPH